MGKYEFGDISDQPAESAETNGNLTVIAFAKSLFILLPWCPEIIPVFT